MSNGRTLPVLETEEQRKAWAQDHHARIEVEWEHQHEFNSKIDQRIEEVNEASRKRAAIRVLELDKVRSEISIEVHKVADDLVKERDVRVREDSRLWSHMSVVEKKVAKTAGFAAGAAALIGTIAGALAMRLLS